MLTEEQRKELETMGAVNVRLHISGYGGGRNSAIGGFRTGDMTRGDIYEWLSEIEAKSVPRVAPVQKLGAMASIGSFFVAACIILPLTVTTFWRQPNPETQRREALVQELIRDYTVSSPSGVPLVAAELRQAAEGYVNSRLEKMGEPFRYDGKSGRLVVKPKK